MTHSQRLSLIRDLIRREVGDETAEFSESMLIRDGYYCGRRFSLGEHSAVWFAEDDQIKLYDTERNLVSRIDVNSAPAVETRRAA